MFSPFDGSIRIVPRFLPDSPIKEKFDLLVNRTTLSLSKFSDFGLQFGGYAYEQTNTLSSFGADSSVGGIFLLLTSKKPLKVLRALFSVDLQPSGQKYLTNLREATTLA